MEYGAVPSLDREARANKCRDIVRVIFNIVDICVSVLCISLAGLLMMQTSDPSLRIGLAVGICAWVAKFASGLEKSIEQSVCMLRCYLCIFVVAAVVLACSPAIADEPLLVPLTVISSMQWAFHMTMCVIK